MMVTLLDLIDFYYECEVNPYCHCKYHGLCDIISYLFHIDYNDYFPVPTAIIYADGET